jgi:hypothetical protein
MHHTQSSRYLIDFSYEKYAGRRYRQCFLLDKSCRKMYTNLQRCYVSGHSAPSAVYHEAGSPSGEGHFQRDL